MDDLGSDGRSIKLLEVTVAAALELTIYPSASRAATAVRSPTTDVQSYEPCPPPVTLAGLNFL